MKKQPHYDHRHFNPNEKPVGDEMGALELAIWILLIGSALGSIVFMWLTNSN